MSLFVVIVNNLVAKYSGIAVNANQPQQTRYFMTTNWYKDIITAIIFMAALFGFISGEYVISSTLFAAAAITSNVNLNRKRDVAGHFSCK
ncbi:hypothetical protein [Methylocucumis oryzae]|uniref:hypothetical protein n=1 Tax=Methylocucumis oryzae TaxID=1632867 RepID=UPI00103F281B|nr:hypothetical protein [Methylocucumis oryzae]